MENGNVGQFAITTKSMKSKFFDFPCGNFAFRLRDILFILKIFKICLRPLREIMN